ncbi:MAG: tetratricopeptide repeat protein, partial [Magnetococcales bacterium]|nr:tetratricopeptide repeat protein [Magnetococcales bacterium]
MDNDTNHSAAHYFMLAVSMQRQGHYEAAAGHYHRVVEMRPDHADTWYNLAVLRQEQGRFDEAAEYHRKVVELRPDFTASLVYLTYIEQRRCNWRVLSHLRQCLIEPALAWQDDGNTPAPPHFPFLAVPDITEAEQCSISRAYSRYKQRDIQPLPLSPYKGRGGERLRIGYLSSDFRDHPVSHQMLGYFKRHDRRRFEVFAYSSGPDDGSHYRRRIENDCDHFVDIRGLSDQDAAQRIRADAIDILIDLNGHTAGARSQILAYRPALVQVVPTLQMGADFIDYLLTDRFFIPPERQQYYSEKIVYLPRSIVVTDGEQPIAATTPGRSAHGLSEQGFVFCCFCHHGKIEPHVFNVWMLLLRDIPGSVFWLADGAGRANLQQAAGERGISPQRLVFAPRLPDKADHLARHRWADLFLDTLYFNAFSTACDALWAGVPLLTCPGNTSFAARAGVSLLHAIGLENDGLIASSLEAYRQRAIELATHPEELARIRQKLWANRLTQPLFDSDRFVRDFEAALEQTWQQWLDSRAPQAESYFAQGLAHHRMNRLADAQVCYERTLQFNPAHIGAYNNLGAIFASQRQWQQAADCCQQALQHQPQSAQLHDSLGVIRYQQQRHAEAADCFRQAVACDPQQAESWYHLGQALEIQRQFEPAYHCYQRVVELKSDHSAAHFRLGVLMQQ